MAEAAEISHAGAQAPAEWKSLYVKRLSQKDLTEKLTLPISNQRSFLDSIPEDDKEGYLSRGIIPATYHVHQSVDLYNESEVQMFIYFREGNIHQDLCSFELPPLQGAFRFDIDTRVQYCWRDKKLHLRVATAYPIYAEMEQMPTGWRLLGRKYVTRTDVTSGTLRLSRRDRSGFYDRIPSPQLKEALHEFVGFQVGIWMREGLRFVSGHIKPAGSHGFDPTSMGLEISCKEAFKENGEFYREGTNVGAYYQWTYGTPFVAIVEDATILPIPTGERYSLF